MRPYGGDEEDRTPDPLLAKQVLSQLSYTPIFGFPSVFQASHCGTVFFSTLKIEQCFLSTLRSPLLTEAYELSFVLLRKEVIQPHLPIRLPCYDFTPVINPTLDGVLPKVRRPALGRLSPLSHIRILMSQECRINILPPFVIWYNRTN